MATWAETKRSGHLIDRIGKRAEQEIERDTDNLAEQFSDEILDDYQDLGKQQFLEEFRRRYGSEPTFAEEMRERMGDEAFVSAYGAAFGVPVKDLTLGKILASNSGVPELDGLMPSTMEAVASAVEGGE